MKKLEIIVREKARPTPTRRAFVAILGMAAAAIATRGKFVLDESDPPQRPWKGVTRWIGHC